MSAPPSAEREALPLLAPRRLACAAIDGAVMCVCVGLYPLGLMLLPAYLIAGARWRTLGLRATGLRVEGRDAAPLSLRGAAVRALPLCVLASIWSLPLREDDLFLVGAALRLSAEVWLFRKGWRFGLSELMGEAQVVRMPPRAVPAPPPAAA